MYEYDKECLRYFLENQSQLFSGPDFPVKTMREAKEFLEDVMAVIVDRKEQVKEYLDENGMDTAGMSMEEILDQSEVFQLPSGRFLIVEA